MKKSLILLAGASMLFVAPPAMADASTMVLDDHEKAEMTEGEKLKALFAKSNEDNLKRNPIGALVPR